MCLHTRKILSVISSLCGWASGTVIVIMMLIMAIDMGLRNIHVSGVQGSVELCSLLMVIASCFAVVYCESKKGHISIDMLVVHFPVKLRSALSVINTASGLCVFGAILLGGITFFYDSLTTDDLSLTLRFPLFPFKMVFALSMGLFSLQLLVSLLLAIKETVKSK